MATATKREGHPSEEPNAKKPKTESRILPSQEHFIQAVLARASALDETEDEKEKKKQFTQVYSLSELRESLDDEDADELFDDLKIGGDPTLNVYEHTLGQPFSSESNYQGPCVDDIISVLGDVLHAIPKDDRKEVEQVCGLQEASSCCTKFKYNGYVGMPPPEGFGAKASQSFSDGWKLFGRVVSTYADGMNLDEAEDYASMINITEEPIAAFVYNLAGNMCWHESLILTETKVYKLTYTNG
eukprot:TRINITY_DN104963_c0_g1_i1.p1 TRINITY_DN104963_c0_g1~~TRINITY_DN104963_c0_g1_i1.p1  ORF type:complete len:242 (+),score=39.68 TRINITY_DN104963_c0_g1_i1:85-810(+)